MRDYTYLNGARFTVCNLFHSLRFDIGRLDMSWVDAEKPEFTRGCALSITMKSIPNHFPKECEGQQDSSKYQL